MAFDFAYIGQVSNDPSLTIRPGRLADLDALVALEQATFASDRLSRRQYRRHLQSRSARVLIAQCGPQPVGAAVVFFRRGAGVARLYSLATAAEVRGKGVGRALLAAAEQVTRQRHGRTLRLEVRVDNVAAIALYERAGYVCIGRREVYYEDGADAWRYEKDLRTVEVGLAPSSRVS